LFLADIKEFQVSEIEVFEVLKWIFRAF
jgi:hypothetical protein